MTPQEECIYYKTLLQPLSKKVRDQLQDLIYDGRKKYWWTIYLTTFILLHSCSIITRRDAELATQLSLPVSPAHTLDASMAYCCIQRQFATPASIEAQQVGMTILLAHFHHLSKGQSPFAQAAREDNLAEAAEVASLDAEAIDLLRYTTERLPDLRKHQTICSLVLAFADACVELQAGTLRTERNFGHDMYWVSQLYERHWKPPPTA